MQELIQEIAKAIGVDPALIEGSGITLLLGALLYSLKVFMTHLKIDEKQVSFEQKLVDMTANAVDAYQKNTVAVEKSTNVLIELVTAVKDLSISLPIKMAAHEASMLKTFVDKADEMHQVVARRDMENEKDRKIRDDNHQQVTAQLELIKKEVSNATDKDTLRSAVGHILEVVDRIIVLLEKEK